MKNVILVLFLAVQAVFVFGQRQNIVDLRPSPDSLDQMIAPRNTSGGLKWKETPTVTWWANLSPTTKAYILSGAGGGSPGTGTADYGTRWIDSTTLGIGVIRDDSASVGVGVTPLATTRMVVRGLGSTSATNSLLVENSAGTDVIVVNDDKKIGINIAPTGAMITTGPVTGLVRTTSYVPLQTFGDTTGWLLGANWSVTGGQAVATAATEDLTYTPAITITSGYAYEVTYALTGYSAGGIQIKIGNTAFTVPAVNHTGKALLKPTSSTGGFRLDPSTAFTGNFDSIGVVQITPNGVTYYNDPSSGPLSNEVIMPTEQSYFLGGGGYWASPSGTYAIGINALSSLTTGIYNTAFGHQALRDVVDGVENIAIGSNACTTCREDYNIAIGSSALGATTLGFGSVAIGFNALVLQTFGNYNSSIGYESLRSSTTGSYNTANGYRAGRYIANGSSANTITDNSVYIGALTKSSASGQTNQTVIGYNATGKGSNTFVAGDANVTVLWLGGEVGWFKGTGSPEGVVTAPIGSFYSRKDGGAGTSMYVKESGTGNTGWVAK
jgi:hypothetical protein